MMDVSPHDVARAGPIAVTAAAALVVLLIEAFRSRTGSLASWVAGGGLLLAVILAGLALPGTGSAFQGMMRTGGFAAFFALVFATAGILAVMLWDRYAETRLMPQGEHHGLLLLSVVGMMLMAAASDLVTLFLGLELMSVVFYILAGFARTRPESNEAALKYFLIGAFATGFLLYGIALIYAGTGTTRLEGLYAASPGGVRSPLVLAGAGLLLVGLLFKVGSVPFHMWVPDVYEGAPTPVAAFMSAAGKAAAFSALLLVCAPRVLFALPELREILAWGAALSMVVGNLLAVRQSSVKRMLAYSSIAHAGYMLTGIVAANRAGQEGVLYYLAAYAFMNLGAFGVLAILESPAGKGLTYEESAGLSSSRPLLAGAMAVFLFSLTGIPPFAGFFGKYYVFTGAVMGGYTWLAVLGVVMSLLSAYYYLRLVVVMYFQDVREFPGTDRAPASVTAVVLAALAVVGLGLAPSAVIGLTAGLF
ncbi:MAG: NADH-quinone oxidoreductase subunit N [Bacteroidota bacterium]